MTSKKYRYLKSLSSPFFGLIFALASTSPGGADAKEYTVDDAVAYARDNSPDLLVSEAESRQMAALQRVLANPELRYGLSAPDSDTDPTQHDIALRFALPSPGQLGTARMAASYRKEQGMKLLQADVWSLEVDIRHRYQHLSCLQGEIEVTKAWVKALSTQSEATQAAMEAGLSTALESSLVQLSLAEAKKVLGTLEDREKRAVQSLAKTLGLDSSADFTPTVNSFGDSRTLSLPPLEEVLQQALQGNAQLAASKARQSEAKANLRASRGEAIPWFNFVQVGADVSSDRALGPSSQLNLGLGIDLPLTAGKAERNQALAEYDLAKASYERATFELSARVRSAYQDVKTAEAQLSDTAISDVVKQASEQATQALEGGQLSRQQWAEIQARQSRVQRAEIEKWYDYYTSLARLWLALGYELS